MENHDQAYVEKRKTKLLEALAKLEHKQWRDWALTLIDNENLSDLRCRRWINIIARGWDELSDEEKFKDYEYAERVLWIIKEHLGLK